MSSTNNNSREELKEQTKKTALDWAKGYLNFAFEVAESFIRPSPNVFFNYGAEQQIDESKKEPEPVITDFDQHTVPNEEEQNFLDYIEKQKLEVKEGNFIVETNKQKDPENSNDISTNCKEEKNNCICANPPSTDNIISLLEKNKEMRLIDLLTHNPIENDINEEERLCRSDENYIKPNKRRPTLTLPYHIDPSILEPQEKFTNATLPERTSNLFSKDLFSYKDTNIPSAFVNNEGFNNLNAKHTQLTLEQQDNVNYILRLPAFKNDEQGVDKQFYMTNDDNNKQIEINENNLILRLQHDLNDDLTRNNSTHSVTNYAEYFDWIACKGDKQNEDVSTSIPPEKVNGPPLGSHNENNDVTLEDIAILLAGFKHANRSQKSTIAPQEAIMKDDDCKNFQTKVKRQKESTIKQNNGEICEQKFESDETTEYKALTIKNFNDVDKTHWSIKSEVNPEHFGPQKYLDLYDEKVQKHFFNEFYGSKQHLYVLYDDKGTIIGYTVKLQSMLDDDVKSCELEPEEKIAVDHLAKYNNIDKKKVDWDNPKEIHKIKYCNFALPPKDLSTNYLQCTKCKTRPEYEKIITVCHSAQLGDFSGLDQKLKAIEEEEAKLKPNTKRGRKASIPNCDLQSAKREKKSPVIKKPRVPKNKSEVQINSETTKRVRKTKTKDVSDKACVPIEEIKNNESQEVKFIEIKEVKGGGNLEIKTVEIIRSLFDPIIDNSVLRDTSKEQQIPSDCLELTSANENVTSLLKGAGLLPIETNSKNDISMTEIEEQTEVKPEEEPKKKEKKYKCEKCSSLLTSSFGLRYHVGKVHTKEKDSIIKPFHCPVEDCLKKYKNNNGLKYHLRKAHNMARGSTEECNKINCN